MNSRRVVKGSNFFLIFYFVVENTPFTFSIEKKKKRKQLKNPPFFLRGFHIFCIFLAAWPSGKAGDCKSLFPSSNPGVASLAKELT